MSSGLEKFANDWQQDSQLQRNFVENPRKICEQYHIQGKEQEQLLNMAKRGGKDLNERISTFLLRKPL
jgi:hypothetical protein